MKAFTELRQQKRMDLSEAIPIGKPLTLTIDPCSLCNFKCSQCLQSAPDVHFHRGMMPYAQFQSIVDGLKRWDGPRIKAIKLYNRGEPLVHPDLVKMLRYLSEADITDRIDLTSNCSLLTEEKAYGLVSGGLDYLRVSIYSTLKEKHARITRSEASPEEIFQNICTLQDIKARLGSKKPYVAVKMFETEDEADKSEFLRLYQSVADEVFFEKLHDFSGFSTQAAMLPGEKEACPWPFFSLTVQSDGAVDCCCVDWEDRNLVGNAFSTPIQEIWSSAALERFRELQLMHRRKQLDGCKNCSVYLTDSFTVDNIDSVSVEAYRARRERRE